MPGARFTVCRLDASPATLTERILGRGRGEGPAILGDELRGLPTGELRRIAERVAREPGVGDVCVDTDGRSVAEVADLVIARAGLPVGA
jgi:hypothetical protein